MYKVSFKNVGEGMVTTNIVVKTPCLEGVLVNIIKAIERWMDGRKFDVKPLDGGEYAVMVDDVMLGSFTIEGV